MPLYAIGPKQSARQIKPSAFSKEKELQELFEENLDVLLGVRFIATEFTTGDRQRGRIDTLGLDQDGYSTIIEYKKSNKDNVINQGLFYLDWLVDHKGDFTVAAQKALGQDVDIDWTSPRVILIAESFSDYDKYAVNRIGANIELWTFHLYGEDLLYLDPIFMAEPSRSRTIGKPLKTSKQDEEAETPVYTLADHLEDKPEKIRSLFEALQERIFALAEEGEITEKPNKNYLSYKHGKNFGEVWIQSGALKIWLDIPHEELDDPYEMSRDVSNVGHWGTGEVEVILSDPSNLDKVLALIEQSYRQTI
jgi:predicted transport protein